MWYCRAGFDAGQVALDDDDLGALRQGPRSSEELLVGDRVLVEGLALAHFLQRLRVHQ